MTNIFIIHGTCGYPEENWFPWLKKELESVGYAVFVPKFPTPKNQTLNNWFNVLDKYKDSINKNSIVIGHSLGVSFLLTVLETYDVRAAFFVAGFTGVIGHQFDDGMKTFSQRKFNWDKIKENCRSFYVFNSDNDPYVRLEKGEELAKNLGVKLDLIKGAGHFNTAAGYTKFELLFEKIKKELNK